MPTFGFDVASRVEPGNPRGRVRHGCRERDGYQPVDNHVVNFGDASRL
jgi:hypothetical protein